MEACRKPFGAPGNHRGFYSRCPVHHVGKQSVSGPHDPFIRNFQHDRFALVATDTRIDNRDDNGIWRAILEQRAQQI